MLEMTPNLPPMFERATAPLTAYEVERFRRCVQRAVHENGGFAAVWLPARGAVITGTVVGGQLIAWHIFPADSEAHGRVIASAMHRALQRAADQYGPACRELLDWSKAMDDDDPAAPAVRH